MTYQANDVDVSFELSAKEQWVTVGFNDVPEMPAVDSLLCKTNKDNRVEAGSYSPKDHMRPVRSEQNSLSVNLLAGEYNDGVISCRLSRPIKPGATDMRDLTQKWYLLFAHGSVANNQIQFHSWRKVSSRKANVSAQVPTPLPGKNNNWALAKAHGMLMVLAWLGFASIGIYMARYKRGETDLPVEFQDDSWFKAHRLLMLLAVGTTIVAIILIFAYRNWTWATGAGAHPVLGIVVLVLALLQPLMALMRPHPNEEKRWIFNWAHRTVGLITLLLAFVNIILGMLLPTLGLLVWGALTAAGIYALLLGVFILGELYAYCWRCTTSYGTVKSSVELKEESESTDSLTKRPDTSDSAVPCFAPKGWMCLFITVLAVVQIIFLILIITSKR